MTKRGINLGCGKVILPCPRPAHHGLIPEALYTDPNMAWDNADWNALPGVNQVVDLFNYPWSLEDNSYDVAIATHIVEHIPHHIVLNGQFVHRHPDYQDGWFAWFGNLWRIMKPGGEVYILSPYGFSNAGMSDPTHTRYLTLATFNYFDAPTNDSPFEYRMAQRWYVDMSGSIMFFHELALQEAERIKASLGPGHQFDPEEFLRTDANRKLNTIVEMMVKLVAIKA